MAVTALPRLLPWLALVAVTVFSNGVNGARCPKGYQYYAPLHLSHLSEFGCYQVVTTSKTYSDAAEHCHTTGGHLAEPRNFYADRLLTLFINLSPAAKYNGFWIGMTNEARRSTFRWTFSGTDTKFEGYNKWKEGQGNLFGRGKGKRCVYQMGGELSQWVASDCNVLNYFVCEPGVRRCLPGYTEYRYAGEQFCLHVPKVLGEFKWAINYCHSIGGHLAAPQHYNAHVALSSAIQLPGPPYVYWIGLKKEINQMNFDWFEYGTDTASEGFSQWHPVGSTTLFGNRKDRKCTYINRVTSKWYSDRCNATKFFVCEQGAPNPCRKDYLSIFTATGERLCLRFSKVLGYNKFESGSFDTAAWMCRNYGGHLPEPRTLELHDALTLAFHYTQLKVNQFWIALDSGGLGIKKWAWSGANVQYTAWQSHALNDLRINRRQRRCGVKRTDSTGLSWTTVKCTTRVPFACEQDTPYQLTRPAPDARCLVHTAGSPCYTFVDGYRRLQDASDVCRKMHGILPIITTDMDMHAIASLVLQNNYMPGQYPSIWLGRTSTAASHYWETRNATKEEKFVQMTIANNNFKLIHRDENAGAAVVCQLHVSQQFTLGCEPGVYLYAPTMKMFGKTTRRFSDAVRNCREAGALIPDSYNEKCVRNYINAINKAHTDNSFARAHVYVHYPNRPNQDYYRWMDRNGNTFGSSNIFAGSKDGRTICMKFTRFQFGCPKNKYLDFPPHKDILSSDIYRPNTNVCHKAGMTVPDDHTLACVQNFVARVKLTHPIFARIPFAGPVVILAAVPHFRTVGNDGNTRPAYIFPKSVVHFRYLCVGTLGK